MGLPSPHSHSTHEFLGPDSGVLTPLSLLAPPQQQLCRPTRATSPPLTPQPPIFPELRHHPHAFAEMSHFNLGTAAEGHDPSSVY
eukprot:COSAG02_NODE_841_length_16613_cov_61.635703_5_plen_85_part_00